jgi:hypothetical protein
VFAATAWFNESIGAAIDVIDSVSVFSNDFLIGHFVTMSHDLITTVGCAAARNDGDEDQIGMQKETKVTCNFSRTPMSGGQLYEKGDTCSGCQTCEQSNDLYGLCVVAPGDVAGNFRFDDSEER